jgi:DNA-binding NtrC family response regulator
MNRKFLLINGAYEQSWEQILTRALMHLGTLQTTNEQVALDKVLQKDFSAIIIDASEVDNLISLVTNIRFYYPNIPLIVATGSPTWQLARELFRLEVSDYVKKSTDAGELSVTLTSLLDHTQLSSN